MPNFTVKITEKEHEKRKVPIWILKLGQKLDATQFKKVSSLLADKYGSYYSRFVSGFVFEKEPNKLEVEKLINEKLEGVKAKQGRPKEKKKKKPKAQHPVIIKKGTIRKNSKQLDEIFDNIIGIKVYSLSNNFSGEPIEEGRLKEVSDDILKEFRKGHIRSLTSEGEGNFTPHYHSNLWYKLSTTDKYESEPEPVPDIEKERAQKLKENQKYVDALIAGGFPPEDAAYAVMGFPVVTEGELEDRYTSGVASTMEEYKQEEIDTLLGHRNNNMWVSGFKYADIPQRFLTKWKFTKAGELKGRYGEETIYVDRDRNTILAVGSYSKLISLDWAKGRKIFADAVGGGFESLKDATPYYDGLSAVRIPIALAYLKYPMEKPPKNTEDDLRYARELADVVLIYGSEPAPKH